MAEHHPCLARPDGSSKAFLQIYAPVLADIAETHDTARCGNLCNGQPHVTQMVCRFCKIGIGREWVKKPEYIGKIGIIGLLIAMKHLKSSCQFLIGTGPETHQAIVDLFLTADQAMLEQAEARRAAWLDARTGSPENGTAQIKMGGMTRPTSDLFDSEAPPAKRVALASTAEHSPTTSPGLRLEPKPALYPPSSSGSSSVTAISPASTANASRIGEPVVENHTTLASDTKAVCMI